MAQKEWLIQEDFDADQSIQDALAIICGQTELESED